MTDFEPVDQETRDHLLSEVHQFVSLVRARIAQATEMEETGRPDAGQRHMDDWREIYGRFSIDLRPGQDLNARFGEILYEKLHAAVLVTVVLATTVAEEAGLSGPGRKFVGGYFGCQAVGSLR